MNKLYTNMHCWLENVCKREKVTLYSLMLDQKPATSNTTKDSFVIKELCKIPVNVLDRERTYAIYFSYFTHYNFFFIDYAIIREPPSWLNEYLNGFNYLYSFTKIVSMVWYFKMLVEDWGRSSGYRDLRQRAVIDSSPAHT